MRRLFFFSRNGIPYFSVVTSQARRKEALLQSAPPNDPAWTQQLEQERQEEIQVISAACEVLGRDLYEVSCRHPPLRGG